MIGSNGYVITQTGIFTVDLKNGWSEPRSVRSGDWSATFAVVPANDQLYCFLDSGLWVIDPATGNWETINYEDYSGVNYAVVTGDNNCYTHGADGVFKVDLVSGE